MKKLLLLMVLLWGGGAYGIWYWTDPQHPARVVSHRHHQARRHRFDDQHNRDDRARRGRRRRCPGGRPDRELRPRPPRPEQDDQLRLAGRAGDRAGPARQRAVPGAGSTRRAAASPRPRPTSSRPRPSSGRPTASWSGVASSRPEGRPSSPPRNTTRPWRTTSRPRPRWPSLKAALAVARADLEEATVNLGYTTIRSPVKGIILDRRINIGQIVVASLNAPSLFLIAKDLSRLEIWSSVNETDIGSIHVGQKVHFTVSCPAARHVRGQGLADPPEREHDAERRHLHRRHRGRQLRAAVSCRT